MKQDLEMQMKKVFDENKLLADQQLAAKDQELLA